MEKKESQTRPRCCVLIKGCFTIIFLRHPSTVAAFGHPMMAPFSVMLLMTHASHFCVSVAPTAHHLMAEDEVAAIGSGQVK